MTGDLDIVGFDAVDATPDPSALQRFLDAVRQSPEIRQRKQRNLARLALARGATALDLGCGTGEDVHALREIVGPSGRAIGIDASVAMIATAHERAVAAGVDVELIVAPATSLPLADRAVDGVYAERVLQHIADAPAAVSEMARVMQPGGRVIVSDQDWDTLVLDTDDAAARRALADGMSRGLANGHAGTRTQRLLQRSGFVDIDVMAQAFVFRDFDNAWPFVLRPLVQQALTAGSIEPACAEALVAEQRQRGADGCFLMAFTIFDTAGTRADRPHRDSLG